MQPFRLGQARLDGVVGEQGFVDVRVGGMQGLVGALARYHQETDPGEGGDDAGAFLFQRALHILQASAAMTAFVARDDFAEKSLSRRNIGSAGFAGFAPE